TILLCLLRSDFWHQQVARNSRFGACVVEHVPALARVVEEQFPDKVWFLDDIPRRQAPTIESN
ncbi:hypothetical protein HQ590_16630, partial [bacterium]|nr:hypothetical protein [bacterium]